MKIKSASDAWGFHVVKHDSLAFLGESYAYMWAVEDVNRWMPYYHFINDIMMANNIRSNPSLSPFKGDIFSSVVMER